MVTRKVLVVKKRSFPAENGDEKGSRRPKIKFRPQKCRREQVLVVKKRGFPPENGDEKGSRRQKMGFSG